MTASARALCLVVCLSTFSCSSDPAETEPADTSDASVDSTAPTTDSASSEVAIDDAPDTSVDETADTRAPDATDTGTEEGIDSSAVDAGDTSVEEVSDTTGDDAAETSASDAADAATASDAADASALDTSSADAGSRPHIVAPGAFTYSEMAETTNGDTAGSEVTGYTANATGAVFTGVFEASSPTTDCFRFDTGAASMMDAQVFIDGVGLTGTPGTVWVSLDGVVFDGLSALSGYDYLVRAAVTPGKAWRVCLTPKPSAAGKSYTVELRQSP